MALFHGASSPMLNPEVQQQRQKQIPPLRYGMTNKKQQRQNKY
jgi:hypothetical protein